MSGRAAREARRYTRSHSVRPLVRAILGPDDRPLTAREVARDYKSARRIRRLWDARVRAERNLERLLKRFRRPSPRWGGKVVYWDMVNEKAKRAP